MRLQKQRSGINGEMSSVGGQTNSDNANTSMSRLNRTASSDRILVRGLPSATGSQANTSVRDAQRMRAAAGNKPVRSASKSNEQIRTQLMSKLTYNKIWLRPSEKPKIHQTCIIFDWDDTILCTTFLAPHQQLIYEPSIAIPAQLQKKLDELDRVAYDLIVKSKKYGKVYIVTNAAEGWV